MAVQKIIKFTDAQAAALDALLSKTGETFADFVRRNAEREAGEHEIVFPQDMPTQAETIKKAYQARWPKDTEMNTAPQMCLVCGQEIARLEQVGACVYARPCGCRQYQGAVEEE